MNEIDNMTPLELRVFIAERLGAKWADTKYFGYLLVGPLVAAKITFCAGRPTDLTQARLADAIPDWPGDIVAALELAFNVAEQTKRKFTLETSFLMPDEPRVAHANFDCTFYGSSDMSAPAMAIARAAAKTLAHLAQKESAK